MVVVAEVGAGLNSAVDDYGYEAADSAGAAQAAAHISAPQETHSVADDLVDLPDEIPIVVKKSMARAEVIRFPGGVPFPGALPNAAVLVIVVEGDAQPVAGIGDDVGPDFDSKQAILGVPGVSAQTVAGEIPICIVGKRFGRLRQVFEPDDQICCRRIGRGGG